MVKKIVAFWIHAVALGALAVAALQVYGNPPTYNLDNLPDYLLSGDFYLDESDRAGSSQDRFYGLVEPLGLGYNVYQARRFQLDPGVYTFNTRRTGTYSYSSPSGGGSGSYDTLVASATTTIVGSVSPFYTDIYAVPAALNCQSDFNLEWTGVSVENGTVLYQVEERSARIGEDFKENWNVIAPSTEDTLLALPKGKPSGHKFQYRISARSSVGELRGALSEPVVSSSFMKPHCSEFTSADLYSRGTVNQELEVMNPVAANHAGISYNKLPEFLVTDQRLAIRNTDGADIIVIESPIVRLQNQIQVLGKPASLVILNGDDSSGSVFRCEGCSFVNVNRLMLANARSRVGLNSASSDLDHLLINDNSSMYVRNLDARGVISLELLSGTLDLDGRVVTNLRGAKDFRSGEFIPDPSGRYIIGSGQVNIFLGGVEVDYDTLSIARTWPLSVPNLSLLRPSTLRGNIESASINISSFEPLTVRAQLISDSDVLATETYRGALVTPRESVKVQTLGPNSALNILSGISAFNRVDLHSRNHLMVSNQLAADSISIVAGGDVELSKHARIEAKTLELAADNVKNSGYIYVNVGNLNAERNLLNQFGGRILGQQINLYAKDGVVRNGSLKPYRMVSGEVSVSSSGGESYQSGTYYSLSQNAQSQAQKVDDLSAQIFARKLSIGAARVENINPYYRINSGNQDWTRGVTFDYMLMNQVSMRATESLIIDARGFLVNSSAEIRLINSDGLIQIQAQRFVNERYRTELVIAAPRTVWQYFDSNSSWEGMSESQKTATLQTSTLQTAPIVYSPPGTVYASGDVTLSTDQGFTNNLSFFEVSGTSRFQGPITSIGARDTKYTFTYRNDPCGRLRYSDRGPPYCERTISEGSSIMHVGTRETLFILHGDTFGPAVNFRAENEQVLRNFVEAAVGHTISDQTYSSQSAFAKFIEDNFTVIRDFWQSIKDSLLGAWDSLINWFS